MNNYEMTNEALTRHSALETCEKIMRGTGFNPATSKLQVPLSANSAIVEGGRRTVDVNG